jgi:hypothetical protein
MIGLLCFVLAVLAAPIKSKMRLEAENAVLRHQLTVFAAQAPGPCPAHEQGSPVADRALPLVSVDTSGSDYHPSRDAHPLAPRWLLLLLVLEVAIFRRPAADRG